MKRTGSAGRTAPLVWKPVLVWKKGLPCVLWVHVPADVWTSCLSAGGVFSPITCWSQPKLQAVPPKQAQKKNIPENWSVPIKPPFLFWLVVRRHNFIEKLHFYCQVRSNSRKFWKNTPLVHKDNSGSLNEPFGASPDKHTSSAWSHTSWQPWRRGPQPPFRIKVVSNFRLDLAHELMILQPIILGWTIKSSQNRNFSALHRRRQTYVF